MTLAVSDAELSAHRTDLTLKTLVLPPRVGFRIDLAENGNRLALNAADNGHELAERNRGPEQAVIKLCELGHGQFAWYGLQEQWTRTPSKGRNIEFVNLGLTFFLGREYTKEKFQVLRAEWCGPTDIGPPIRFDAGQAGHPHWQFDALETIRRLDERAVAENVAFGATWPQPNFDDTSELRQIRFEKLHLASAGNWWSRSTNTVCHQHAPPNTAALTDWTIQTLNYAREQFLLLQH